MSALPPLLPLGILCVTSPTHFEQASLGPGLSQLWTVLCEDSPVGRLPVGGTRSALSAPGFLSGSSWLGIRTWRWAGKQACSLSFPILHSFVYSLFAQMIPVRNQRGCGTGRAEFIAAVLQGMTARTERLGKGTDLSGEPCKARFSLGPPLGVGAGRLLGPFPSVGLSRISLRLSRAPMFGSLTTRVLGLFP